MKYVERWISRNEKFLTLNGYLFNETVSIRHNTASHGRMIMNNEKEKIGKEAVRA
jgi:hypothetical protein